MFEKINLQFVDDEDPVNLLKKRISIRLRSDAQIVEKDHFVKSS